MKHFKLLIPSLVLIAFCFLASSSQAQLHVESSGEVGIGTTAPSAKLEIASGNGSSYNVESRNTYNGASTKIGIYNYSTAAGTGTRYGIYNLTYGATAATNLQRGIYNYGFTYSSNTGYGMHNYFISRGGNGVRYGLYNYLNCDGSDGTGSRFALYSRVSTTCDGGAAWAGYFVGDVYISGTLSQPSDERKKENVQNLSGATGLLMRLRPTTYNYIDDPEMSLPRGKQYGFIAQEIAQVFPDLVSPVEVLSAPQVIGEDGETSEPEVLETIQSVNYTALIPVLVQAIQEQQAEIDALKAELARK